jgi:hypothetical protein
MTREDTYKLGTLSVLGHFLSHFLFLFLFYIVTYPMLDVSPVVVRLRVPILRLTMTRQEEGSTTKRWRWASSKAWHSKPGWIMNALNSLLPLTFQHHLVYRFFC